MSAMSEAMGSINNLTHPDSDKKDSSSPEMADKEHIPLREQCVNYLVEMMKLGDADSGDPDPSIPRSSPPQEDAVDKLNQDIQDTQLNDAEQPPSVTVL
jgi:hypothetical protein